MQQPYIFDIKHYAINDGPGIRLTIFFKGCPLFCLWCHNPESISPKQQKMFTASKCIGCGECVKACPVQAIEMTAEGIVTDPDKCTLCGLCAEVCPTKAIEMSGRHYSIEELMTIIEKERPFFDQSGGGVTISGGEPMMYADFLLALLKECGRQGIHRTVDTSGYCDQKKLLEVAEHVDLFLFDLKLIDDTRHHKYTGVSNEKILSNLQALAAAGAEIAIRIPVIMGVNADTENMKATARFVAALPGDKRRVNLLPYHGIAANKHLKLGKEYQEGAMGEPPREVMERIIACFSAQGMEATEGG